MWNVIKKDFLTISRDRSEVLVLLIMPFILIAILGFALGGLMSGTNGIEEIPVALVNEQDIDQAILDLEVDLRDQGIPNEIVADLIANIEDTDPATSFINFLTDPDLDDILAVSTDYDKESAMLALEEEEIAAIVIIPEQFSYHLLSALYLDEGTGSKVELVVQNKEQIQAGIVENIVQNFNDHFNFETSIIQATEGAAVQTDLDTVSFGETVSISMQDPVSAFQYYTIGMAVMFALYVASTVSANAFKEKKSHVFARLMITGETPLRYLFGKFTSAIFLTFLQLAILFSVSHLLFQTFENKNVEFWLVIGLITFVFSATVSTLAMLITSIALRFNNDTVSGIFSGGVITLFAFVGGSFTPVEQISPFIRELGNWTPNGAIMTAYLQMIQGFEISEILPMLYRVCGMAILFILLAVAIFPKRRLT